MIDSDGGDYDPDKVRNDVSITQWLTPMDIELLYNAEGYLAI